MSLSVIVEPDAENDIIEAKSYYQLIDHVLSSRFLNELKEHFSFLTRNPEAFPVVYKDYRRMLLNHFPYAVFYIIEGDIHILAVFHQKSNIERNIQDR